MTTADAALAITRVFDAPPDAVFRAWTDPELARTWWSPRGFTTLTCDMDVRPGGAWKVRMRSPSGRIHSEQGVFREVAAPERLVFTQVWDDPSGKPGVETLVTVTFAPHGEAATKVRFEQGPFETATSCAGHEGGWSSCFDLLSGELAEPSAAGAHEGGSETARAIEETELRALAESCARAIRTKDAAALARHYAPDALVFDLAPPLARGATEIASVAAQWFATWKGAIECTIHELRVHVGCGVAFSTAFHHLRGEKTSGERVDIWWRATHGYAKRGGAWLVVNEHTSVPFYMDGSERAATDLKP